MRPEDKVVTLETAKKLKEAGFPQDTERWWFPHREMGTSNLTEWKLLLNRAGSAESLAAPDAQEIGELLPFVIGSPDPTSKMILRMTVGGSPNGKRTYSVGYVDVEIGNEGKYAKFFGHENEAEARAACWLYLKQQGII